MDSFSTGVSLDRTNIHSFFKSISEPPRDLFLRLPKFFYQAPIFCASDSGDISDYVERGKNFLSNRADESNMKQFEAA